MGQWNQLPEFLAQCTQSPEEAHRDVAFVLFASLTETIISAITRLPRSADYSAPVSR